MAKQKEKPKPFMVRLYKEQRKLIRRHAKLNNASEAEIIRRVIDGLVA